MSGQPASRQLVNLDREMVIGGLGVALVYALLILVSPHWPYLLPGMIALAVLPFAPAALRRLDAKQECVDHGLVPGLEGVLTLL